MDANSNHFDKLMSSPIDYDKLLASTASLPLSSIAIQILILQIRTAAIKYKSIRDAHKRSHDDHLSVYEMCALQKLIDVNMTILKDAGIVLPQVRF